MTSASDAGRYRILHGTELVPATLEQWAESFNHPEQRVVRSTGLHRRRRIFVSTVCLGLDHGYGLRPPQWFETMVFGTSIDGFQRRYSTYQEAVEGHADAVHRARQARQTRNRMHERLRRLK